MSFLTRSNRPMLQFLALAITSSLVPVHLASADSGVEGTVGRLATTESKNGMDFALSIQPSESRFREQVKVAVVVDTSATQIGAVRTRGLGVVDSMLAALPSDASVSLMACDVSPVKLSEGMQPVGSESLCTAMDALKLRIPLGTTDLPAALEAAVAEVGEKGVVVYIGDGVSCTNAFQSDSLQRFVSSIRERQVSIVSYAVGVECNNELLAILANHSGGVIYIDQNIEGSAEEVGRQLASAVCVDVVWPDSVDSSEAIADHFPRAFPPLRHDRDSILLGRLGTGFQSASIQVSGNVSGEDVELNLDLEIESPNPDFAFVSKVIEAAEASEGLMLPTAGSAALRELGNVFSAGADDLVKNGRFALHAGDAKSALNIAREALERDPNNLDAANLRDAASAILDQALRARIGTHRFVQVPGGQIPGVPDSGTTVPSANGTGLPFGDMSEFDELANGGDLLNDIENQRRLAGQRLEAEVANQLRLARVGLNVDPSSVISSLKSTLEEVRRTPDLDPSSRVLLETRLSSALQSASLKERDFLARLAQREAIEAQASQNQRLLAEQNRDDFAVKQLVERFNALMAQEAYAEANNGIAPAIDDLVGGNSEIALVTERESNILANAQILDDILNRRRRNFVDLLTTIENGLVPFVDEPPVQYPPPDVWRALTARRERYASVDLAGSNEAERNIYNKLSEKVDVDYTNTPVRQILDDFSVKLNFPLYIDENSILDAGASTDDPVTLAIGEVSLRSALRLILEASELTYVIEDEVMKITTKDAASSQVVRIFPVGDLVVPIMQGGMGMMGGMGGMGGGMGGMGGMGGGMGGMGGGMGGMGGGMGGMGGGMFCVDDQPAKKLPATPVDAGSLLNQAAAALESGDNEKMRQSEAEISEWVRNRLAHAQSLLSSEDRDSAKQEFAEIIDFVGTCMREGYPQPWMYEALSISMQVCDYPEEEIYRVLMSNVDFSGDVWDAIKVAKFLESREMFDSALRILKDVHHSAPMLAGPLEMAFAIAEKTGDYSQIQWAAVGVLEQGWPDEKLALIEKAKVTTKSNMTRLVKESRVMEATQLQSEVAEALGRDLVVRIAWSGDSDLDISVEEPAGTVCSHSNRRTTSGGMLLGDGNSFRKAEADGFSESYVCSKGFSGIYRVLVSKAWGEVAANKVTIDIVSDYGTDEQSYVHQVLELEDNQLLIEVAVKNGRRSENIVAGQLARINEERMRTGQRVLAQQITDGSEGSRTADYFSESNPQFAQAGQNPFFGQNRSPFSRGVGYRPDVTVLPSGAMGAAQAVISGDRRYVRITPITQFSQINDVQTFNFITGDTADGGGGGLGGGGFGGGGFGGGGQF